MAFRDYLRKHYDVLSNTGQLNIRQKKAAGKIQRTYDRLKNEFIQRHEQLALAWLATGETP
ncbi:hypothetical protein CDA58_11760 [Serratia marcescens]|uniref:hypothetical protein n=1 Tax=Serratia marcescens TaxID=615 RepID=UPI000B4D6435|nr:hypothetical protein [Serratia marcescens]ASC78594.1 hypothetical protein CDA58_11760 [Serratia marcescens]